MSIRSEPKERENETKMLSPIVASNAANVRSAISSVMSTLVIDFIAKVIAIMVNNSRVIRSVKIDGVFSSQRIVIMTSNIIVVLLNIIISEGHYFWLKTKGF